MRITTAAEAVAYIEGFAVRPPEPSPPLPPHERLAAHLAEMYPLLAVLGHPQDRLRVVHVTGTSGKGSTATMVAAIARAAGLHVGLYTNPYVVASQERVQLDGAFISDAEFVACTQIVADALDALPGWRAHHKQVFVALALLAFARAAVDLAVIEVGMGGRFDETNVVQPVVSIITTIGFDHMEFLGDTLPAIAWHKAGIIKPGAPAVTGATAPDVLTVIQHEADAAQVPLEVLGRDFTVMHVAVSATGTHFTYADAAGHLDDLLVPLPGAFQAHNAALAIRAARHAMPDLAAEAIRAGLAKAWLPGRFEIVAQRPTVVLDVAHNPEKIRALATTLPTALRWRRLWVIFGALGTKDSAPMLAALAPLQPHLIATVPPVTWRLAQRADHVAAIARAQGITEATAEPDPTAAIELALAQAAPEDVVVVTGSLFLVSAVRHRWRA
jgi:dihydrofolate synthase/folylpolyglutamate synthase